MDKPEVIQPEPEELELLRSIMDSACYSADRTHDNITPCLAYMFMHGAACTFHTSGMTRMMHFCMEGADVLHGFTAEQIHEIAERVAAMQASSSVTKH